MQQVINIIQEFDGERSSQQHIEFITTDKKQATKFFREKRNEYKKSDNYSKQGNRRFSISGNGTTERWYWEIIPLDHHKVWISNEKWVWKPYQKN